MLIALGQLRTTGANKKLVSSGQSEGERGGNAFPLPPIFILCSSPTCIQMVSVNYMLKSHG